MTALTSQDVLRPAPPGLGGAIRRQVAAAIPFGLAVLRRVRPILKLRGFCVVTLHDDVREVFATDSAFGAPYRANLDVLTGGLPFFLGMEDTPDYRAGVRTMRQVMTESDLVSLGDKAEALAEACVAASTGRIEVVAMVRQVTFDLLAPYLGVPEPPQGRLDVWATRLFEFQFTGTPKDVALRAEVDEIAPAFRAHLDAEIARRKSAPPSTDDVLGRCLDRQAKGEPGYGDAEIRTNLLCMVVGGPPQPPMVLPQAMEQLMRRPDALAAAQHAAQRGDDRALHDIVLEAMRFDPLAPGLPRRVLRDGTIARGTPRETKVTTGDTVLVAFASAMMDERRVPDPKRFDSARLPNEYIHFGWGLHECFGRQINHATLHRMLKPLLKQPALRRAPGAAGRLRKNGIFAERLILLHG